MEVIKNESHVLLRNNKGEYHFSIEDYNNITEEEAIEIATNEIDKKSKSGQYNKVTINYETARSLGFCEYGIKDFCKRLDISVEDNYNIIDLYNLLDIYTVIEYPEECKKLFGDRLFDKFNIVEVLDSHRSRRTLNFVINSGKVDDIKLHTLAYMSTMRVIGNFERLYPEDKRPRQAIEAKMKFIKGEIIQEELSAAWSAVESAARSAAWSAVESAARSVAWSATWSATWSARSAVESAARSATWSARSVELDFQVDTLIKLIKGEIEC